jgi:hypothetical protein
VPFQPVDYILNGIHKLVQCGTKLIEKQGDHFSRQFASYVLLFC